MPAECRHNYVGRYCIDCGFKVGTDPASLVEPTDARPAGEAETLREQLADLAHEQWSGWMRHMFSRFIETPEGPVPSPSDYVRWTRQMNTPYVELSEAEKDSDRQEADRVLALLSSPAPVSPDLRALRVAVRIVVDAFQRDEAQGYHSRDRRFALDVLLAALEGSDGR